MRSRIKKNAKGTTNTRGQRPRRAVARVLPTAPRLAADCFAGSSLEAMALGVSWMGWRRPAAPHGQQRRGYSGRTSERSRDVVVGRESFKVQGDKKTGFAAVSIVSRRRRRSRLC